MYISVRAKSKRHCFNLYSTHTHTTILRPSSILSGTTRVSWHQKGKTNLDLLEQEIVSGSGISRTKSAPCPRHITLPASHHSVFYRPDALPATQPAASKHWRQNAIQMSSLIIITINGSCVYLQETYHQFQYALLSTDCNCCGALFVIRKR